MRAAMLTVLVFGLAGAAHAESPAQFGLTCKGTLQEVNGSTSGERDYYGEMSVDLDARLYCSGLCDRTYPIKDVSADRITFEDHGDKNSGDIKTLERWDGTFVETVWIGASTRRIIGKCERTPFRPLPTPKF